MAVGSTAKATATPAAPAAARAERSPGGVQTAPLDELVSVVQELITAAPKGVSLDELANALRERGFRRKAGSPRLITRLRLIKDIEVARDGMIRLAGETPPATGGGADAAGNGSGAPDDSSSEDGAPSGGGNGRRRRRRGGRGRRGRRSGDQAAEGSADGAVV